MQELLITIVKGLVENPDAVSVTVDEVDDRGVVVYHLHVAEDDMGRVIGKQGRIAAGCGMQVEDVNRLLNQHRQMQKMFKQMNSGKMKRQLKRMGFGNGMNGMGGMGGMGGFPM